MSHNINKYKLRWFIQSNTNYFYQQFFFFHFPINQSSHIKHQSFEKYSILINRPAAFQQWKLAKKFFYSIKNPGHLNSFFFFFLTKIHIFSCAHPWNRPLEKGDRWKKNWLSRRLRFSHAIDTVPPERP